MMNFLFCGNEFLGVLERWQTMIVGFVGASLALKGYFAARAQVAAIYDSTRVQVQAVKRTLQAESMFKLIEIFDSPNFKGKQRHDAASCCLTLLSDIQRNPEIEQLSDIEKYEDIDDILDFFEDAAFLVKIEALDVEMVWHSFYYWIQFYYQASESYIAETRRRDPTQWNALFDLCPHLQGIEARERQKAGAEGSYSWKLDDAEIIRKLQQETKNDNAAYPQQVLE